MAFYKCSDTPLAVYFFFLLTILCTVPIIGTPGTGPVKGKLNICYRVYLQLL